MPGGYPEAPTQRLAYDLDQSQVFWIRNETGALVTTYNSTTIEDLNNEHSGRVISESNIAHTVRNQWLFPGPRDLFGVWAAGSGDEPVENFFTTVEVSANTRSWNTGSWSATGAGFSDCDLLWDRWRRDIQTFTADEQWGLRGYSGAQGGFEFVGKIVRQVHIYGAVTDSYYPDRIIVLDDDTGLELTLHDWGYNPRGTVQTKVLQVRNNSMTSQASGVTLSFNSLNTHDPAGWHELQDGAGAFQDSLSLGDIGPNTVYANNITMRITVPPTAGMGPWSNRLVTGVTTWGEPSGLDGLSQGETSVFGELDETGGTGFDSGFDSGFGA